MITCSGEEKCCFVLVALPQPILLIKVSGDIDMNGKRNRVTLAVDLGGTKVMVGEVLKNGTVLNSKKYPSVVKDQVSASECIIECICDYIDTFGIKLDDIVSIGIGVVGRVDRENGIWIEIDPGRSNKVELAKLIEEKFGVQCKVENDVNCATIAEMKLGWGRKTNNFIYLNVGTGIAIGTVVDGQLVRGSHFNSGEVGHFVVDVNSDVTCPCGRKGCLEVYASGLGLDKRIKALKKEYKDTKLEVREDEPCNLEKVFELYDEGDKLCVKVIDDAVKMLSATIMNLVRVSDPDAIVLGGGVVSNGWLIKKIKENLHPKTMRFVTNGVVLSDLNINHIGLIGAAMVGFE